VGTFSLTQRFIGLILAVDNTGARNNVARGKRDVSVQPKALAGSSGRR
jgi:hypothetical protein